MPRLTVITIGDSVAWGQGLPPEQKFDHLAALDIARAIGAEAQIENRAHSGATINPPNPPQGPLDPGTPAWQEVPNGSPTLHEQITPPNYEADLVIMVGGINDINFRRILDPTPTSERALENLVRQNCYDAMKDLLWGARAQFPNAVLVVAGYYPMLSEMSELDILRLSVSLLMLQFSPLVGAFLDVAVAKRATRRVRYFYRSQLHWLRRAVAEAHADANVRGPAVLFAHPAFGHPNLAGARQYADAITDVYLRNRRVSLRSVLAEMSGSPPPFSLRRALGSYGLLGLWTSVRASIPHARVDSIAIRVKTKDVPFAGTDHPVFLRVGPGREWRLNEAVFDGDLFDDFEPGKDTWYYLDPAEGDPGHRLQLREIEELSLVLKFDAASVLGGDWKPETVSFAVNGREILSATVDKELSVDPLHQLDSWTAPNFPL